MTPVRVLVVDDHSLFRRGLIGILEEMPGVKVVGEASNGKEAVTAAERSTPELVFMDVHMPEMDGVEAVRTLRQSKFTGRILMLTVSQNEQDLAEALRAGADGYLLKNLEPADLERAVRQAGEGMGVLSPELTKTVLQAYRAGPAAAEVAELSPREQDVLAEIAKGATTAQVAETLFISEPTVKTHVKNIFRKLGATNRAEAIHIANQAGLLPLSRNHPKG